MAEAFLTLEKQGKIARLVLAHPPVNALGTGMIRALNQALDEIGQDETLSVLQIKSSLKVFCAGADLAEMRANFADASRIDQQIEDIRDIQKVLKRIEALPLVSLAEIGGAAMGGGFELALACDLRVAASEAKLALPETNLGLIPGAGGTQRLTNLVGAAMAKRLILGAEILDGATAQALGLVQWAVPRSELSAHADALAQRLAGLPGAALSAAKSCIEAAHDPHRDGYEEELTATRRLLSNEPETRQRVEAFLNKESPA
ncbi:MAG: enoyl-CoA hydratase/isomerase family protein [Alphaproteobacteria bacterium]|nr:enoyl-CoA hydratase/isomerase family protein [Alphaproteobacteria bacterium]